jgi:hypothetical protein
MARSRLVIPTASDALEVSEQQLRRGLWYRRAGTAVLAAFVAAAALGWFGLRTHTVRAASGDLAARLTYSSITRRGVTTPWQLTVARVGGLPDQIAITVTRDYLEGLDLQRVTPQPSDEQSTTNDTRWTFDTSRAETMVVSLDAAADPQVQPGRHPGRVIVRADAGESVTLHFTTVVMP